MNKKLEWFVSEQNDKNDPGVIFAQVTKNVQIVIRHSKGSTFFMPSIVEKGWHIKIIFFHNFDMGGYNDQRAASKAINISAGIPYLDSAKLLAEKAWREFNEAE